METNTQHNTEQLRRQMIFKKMNDAINEQKGEDVFDALVKIFSVFVLRTTISAADIDELVELLRSEIERTIGEMKPTFKKHIHLVKLCGD
jgi:hypothetical protein